MSRKFLTAVDLVKNELQNAVIQNLASAPSSPVKGQIYFDSTANILYWWDGTAWRSAAGGTPFPGFGSVTAETTYGAASADGVGTTSARNDHKHGNPTHVTADHSAVVLSGLAAPTAAINMNNQKITNVAGATANADAVNKLYVDNTVGGIAGYHTVVAASTANVPLSGATAGPTIDGVAFGSGAMDASRLLLKNQTAPAENGIYYYNYGVTSYTLSRAIDLDNWAEAPGNYVFVQQGTVNADSGWLCTADLPGNIGTTAMPWVQFYPLRLDQILAPTAPVNMNGQLVTNVATPVSGTDAANKAYVDGVAAGLDPKASVRLLSTTLVGGTASGAQTIDGVATANGDRVLINNGTNATNGIYVVAAGTWARATDMDSWAEVPGAFMFVEEGTLYADTGWVSTANTGGTLGTTNMPFTQFSGPGAVIAGNGLTQTGNQIDVVAADASIVVTANAIAAGLAGTGSAVTVARSDHTHTAPPTTRYNVNVGGATSVVVNHALGTRDVQVQVYRVAAPFDTIECDVERTDTANVTVRFTVAPAVGEYRVTVMA